MSSYETYIRKRSQKSLEAFEAIDAAKEIIKQLEYFASATAEGKLPNLDEVALSTSNLRAQVDKILVALVEARTTHAHTKI